MLISANCKIGLDVFQMSVNEHEKYFSCYLNKKTRNATKRQVANSKQTTELLKKKGAMD
jgi:hypothetical protein